MPTDESVLMKDHSTMVLSFLGLVIPGSCHSWVLSFLGLVIPGSCHSWVLSFLGLVIPAEAGIQGFP
jgi:hypothetical protein